MSEMSGVKALGEMKAEPMDGSRLERWLSGKIPRRILVVPFGGSIPSKDGKGRDLDGEYFDADTDLYGPFATLRNTRARLTDWHHDDFGVPEYVAAMKGAIVGKIMLDEQPEKVGMWADFWANVGEARRKLFAELEERGVPLFGSSEAVPGSIKRGEGGHIDVWPLIRHTITTSPQNRLAVVPSLKAWLSDADTNLADIDPDALKAYLVGINDDPDHSGSTPRSGRDSDEGRRLSTLNAAHIAAMWAPRRRSP